MVCFLLTKSSHILFLKTRLKFVDVYKRQALDRWEASANYLYIVVRHSDSDEVAAGFREVGQLLEWQEEAEYTSANARLIEELRLLADMEQFNLRNLL